MRAYQLSLLLFAWAMGVSIASACQQPSPTPTPTPPPTPTPDPRLTVAIVGNTHYYYYLGGRERTSYQSRGWSEAIREASGVREWEESWPSEGLDVIVWLGDYRILPLPQRPPEWSSESCAKQEYKDSGCTFFPDRFPNLLEKATKLRQWIRGGGTLVIGPIGLAEIYSAVLPYPVGLTERDLQLTGYDRWGPVVVGGLYEIPRFNIPSLIGSGGQVELYVPSGLGRTYKLPANPNVVEQIPFIRVFDPAVEYRVLADWGGNPVLLEATFGKGRVIVHQLEIDARELLSYAEKLSLERRQTFGNVRMEPSGNEEEKAFEILLEKLPRVYSHNKDEVRQEIASLKLSLGEEMFAKAIERLPIYDGKSGKFESFGQWARTSAKSSGEQQCPFEKDPVKSTLLLIKSPEDVATLLCIR